MKIEIEAATTGYIVNVYREPGLGVPARTFYGLESIRGVLEHVEEALSAESERRGGAPRTRRIDAACIHGTPVEQEPCNECYRESPEGRSAMGKGGADEPVSDDDAGIPSSSEALEHAFDQWWSDPHPDTPRTSREGGAFRMGWQANNDWQYALKRHLESRETDAQLGTLEEGGAS